MPNGLALVSESVSVKFLPLELLGIKRIRKVVSFHLYFEVQTLSNAMNVVKQSLMLSSVMQGCAYGLREKCHQHVILERQSIKLYVLTHKSLINA